MDLNKQLLHCASAFFYEISIYVTSEMERDIWIVAFRHFIMYYDGTGILRTRKEHIF